MKTVRILAGTSMLGCMLILSACSTPVGLSSWKNPSQTATVSKVVVLALFDKLNIMQSMEQSFADYNNSQGLKTVQSLSFMVPFQQYQMNDVQKKLDSLGADGLLIITPKAKDVTLYNQPGYYGFYRGYYGGGVSTSTTYTLRANLYTTKSEGLLWTGDITVTDPNDIGGAMREMAQAVYADWLKNNLLKFPPQPKQ